MSNLVHVKVIVVLACNGNWFMDSLSMTGIEPNIAYAPKNGGRDKVTCNIYKYGVVEETLNVCVTQIHLNMRNEGRIISFVRKF